MKCFAPLILSFFLVHCSTEESPDATTSSTEEMQIQSFKVPCTGLVLQECYRVKIGEEYPDGEWTLFYSEIEEFEYTPGFIYTIEIEKTERNPVPQDASMYRYVFRRLISKEPAD